MRLTSRKDGKAVIDCDCAIQMIIDKLCMYEDAEEEGSMVALPLKYGEHFYEVADDYDIEELTVHGYQINADGKFILDGMIMVNADNLDFTVFRTREEAEAHQKKSLKRGDSMRLRDMKLSDFGIDKDLEAELYERCKQMSRRDKYALEQLSIEVNDISLALPIADSLTKGESYDVIFERQYIPINRDDFYAHRRYTLAQFYELMVDKGKW